MQMTKGCITVTFPDGTQQRCATPHSYGHQLLQAEVQQTLNAEVWWGRVEDYDRTVLHETVRRWGPWFKVLHPTEPPADPPHCTMNYSLSPDENYDTLWSGLEFESEVHGHPAVKVREIYVGKQGVAAAVELTSELQVLYALQETSAPHITLLIQSGGEAKNMGPMVKAGVDATDWVPTQNVNLHYSQANDMYRIAHTSEVKLIPEKHLLSRTHGRENTDHENTQLMLVDFPDTFWTKGGADVGLIPMAPVVIELKTGTVPIYRPQYPLREEQIAGIEKTIEVLLQAGVLERTGSPWNTPINPVPKPGKPDYRMVHDLRLVNKVVVPTHYDTPNPYTMLNAIGPDKRWFTCIDLANAFFCVPLAVRSRQMFAFTYKGRQYTYTRLPQGYVDSPSIFNHVLETILAELELPEGVVLLQYVDDILLAGTSSETIMSATRTVLQWLQENGFKVSKSKLQIGRQKVNFLWRIVSPSGQAMTDTQKSSILQHPRPTTVREMMKFLGLVTWS